MMLSAQKVVAAAYEKWSLTRGYNYTAMTGKYLVFRRGGRSWEVVAYERFGVFDRWSLMRDERTWKFDCIYKNSQVSPLLSICLHIFMQCETSFSGHSLPLTLVPKTLQRKKKI